MAAAKAAPTPRHPENFNGGPPARRALEAERRPRARDRRQAGSRGTRRRTRARDAASLAPRRRQRHQRDAARIAEGPWPVAAPRAPRREDDVERPSQHRPTLATGRATRLRAASPRADAWRPWPRSTAATAVLSTRVADDPAAPRVLVELRVEHRHGRAVRRQLERRGAPAPCTPILIESPAQSICSIVTRVDPPSRCVLSTGDRAATNGRARPRHGESSPGCTTSGTPSIDHVALQRVPARPQVGAAAPRTARTGPGAAPPRA